MGEGEAVEDGAVTGLGEVTTAGDGVVTFILWVGCVARAGPRPARAFRSTSTAQTAKTNRATAAHTRHDVRFILDPFKPPWKPILPVPLCLKLSVLSIFRLPRT
jgi:hypothetical protein